MDRKLVKFMNQENIHNNKELKDINSKNVAVYNIRKSIKGLLFDIRINNKEKGDIKNIFISSKFYMDINQNVKDLEKSANKFVAYLLIYPLAVLSLGVIFAAIFKYIPELQSLLNFSNFY